MIKNTFAKAPLFLRMGAFLLLLIVLVSSCNRNFQEVSFSGIESMKLVKLSQNGVEAEITARIKNPNSSAFTIYKSDVDVTLSGLNAGKAHLANNVRIKANSEESYTFKIKSDFSGLSITDIPKVIAMAMSKNVEIGIKGNIQAGKFLIKKSFPVNITRSVPLNLTK